MGIAVAIATMIALIALILAALLNSDRLDLLAKLGKAWDERDAWKRDAQTVARDNLELLAALRQAKEERDQAAEHVRKAAQLRAELQARVVELQTGIAKQAARIWNAQAALKGEH
jgi:hypothetical protein